MSGATRGTVVLAALALLGGLAWWLLGSALPPSPRPDAPRPGPVAPPKPAPPSPEAPSAAAGPAAAEETPPPAPRGTLSISGRVVDPAGKPVAGALVRAADFSDSAVELLRGFAIATMLPPTEWLSRTTSGPDGTFRLSSLAAGPCRLMAESAGFAPSSWEEVVLSPTAATAPVELVLRRGHTLVVVLETRDSRPPPELTFAVRVASVERPGLSNRAMYLAIGTPDEKGRTRFDGLPSGSVAVTVKRASGHPTRTLFRTAEIPRDSEITIALEGSAAFLVRVRDTTGAPVEKASLEAFLGSEEGNGAMQTGQTDVSGTAQWDGLTPGRMILLTVEKEGFAPVVLRGEDGSEEIVEGTTLEKEVVLRPGASIAGFVRRRHGDAPVPGARVTLYLSSLLAVGPVRSVASDASGAFRFDGVPEGPAVIFAVAEGASTPGVGVDALLTAGTTPKEKESDLVVHVPAGPAEVARDVFVEATGSVSGRVIGPSGDPVPGARVDLRSGRPNYENAALESLFPGPIVAGADGRFEFRDVPAAKRWVVAARAPGLVPAASAPFALAAGGEVSALELRLDAGGTLVGRVTGTSGAPVAWARVRATVRGPPATAVPGSPASRGLEAATDPEGSYRIRPVPSGQATVTVEADGFVEASRGNVSVATDAESRADFSLEPSLSIAGTVRDVDGHPVAGARVTARLASGGMFQSRTRPWSATSGPKGEFLVPGLPPGTFTIRVESPRHPAAEVGNVAAGTASLEVQLPRGARIAGKVVDALGNPLSGIRVTAQAEEKGGGLGGATSASDGTFAIPNLEMRNFRVTAAATDGMHREVEVKGIPAGSEGVLLRMEVAFEIRGRVLGLDGAPSTERPRIRALNRSGRQVASTRADGQGAFVLGGLAEGTYTLRAAVSDRQGTEGTVTAPAGAEDVVIRLMAR